MRKKFPRDLSAWCLCADDNLMSPVIASNNSSIPEIAGKAALLFNEKSSDELSALIKKVTGTRQLRLKMKADGLIRVKKFSWEKTAAMILKIIKTESGNI